MAIYSFFPCQANGHALSFETADEPGDAAAFVQSVVLLEEHSTAAYVAVWCGDRAVCLVPRDTASLPAVLTHDLRPEQGS